MAIDPRISLAGNAPINIGQRFGQTLQNLRNIDVLNQQRDLAPLQQQQAQLQTDLLTAQQPAQLQQAELAASPEQQQINRQQQVQQFAVQSAQALSPLLAAGNIEGATRQLQAMKTRAFDLGLDTVELDKDILQLQTPEGVQSLIAETDRALVPVSGQASVGQREFESLVNIAKNDPKGKTIEGRAAGVKLGTIAKASSTAAERIAQDPELTGLVATSEATIAGRKAAATEEAKLKKQLKFKPEITKAVKLAEKAATEQGEVLTDLGRMEAGLPGLRDAVSQLKELSVLATSTLGGRAFDFAVKESGFGSTKGATAKAKMKAIIANQTLPLLKETFGSAFTETEGKKLEAAFADPDATHEERLAQLDAFIDQKERTIKAKEAQLGQTQEGASTQEGTRATNPQTGQVAIFTNGQWVVQ